MIQHPNAKKVSIFRYLNNTMMSLQSSKQEGMQVYFVGSFMSLQGKSLHQFKINSLALIQSLHVITKNTIVFNKNTR